MPGRVMVGLTKRRQPGSQGLAKRRRRLKLSLRCTGLPLPWVGRLGKLAAGVLPIDNIPSPVDNNVDLLICNEYCRAQSVKIIHREALKILF